MNENTKEFLAYGLGAAIAAYLVAQSLSTYGSTGRVFFPLATLLLNAGLSTTNAFYLSFSLFIVEVAILAVWGQRRIPKQVSTGGKPARPQAPSQEEGSVLDRFVVKEKPKPVYAPTPVAPSTPSEPVPTSEGFLDVFPLESGDAGIFGAIARDEVTGKVRYVVIEPTLEKKERLLYFQLRALLVDELTVDLPKLKSKKAAEDYLEQQVKKVAGRYGFRIPKNQMNKLLYYFRRDFIHYGKLEPFFHDSMIEDISCDGPKVPIYVWHRDYESIPTNVVFYSDNELNSFVSKLAYEAGRHVSLANPMVEAALPDGSRVQLSYGREVSQKGSNFTIRRFRPDPLTIVDLIKYNTLDAPLASYLWLLMEKRMSLLVGGGTASGKSIPGNAQVLVYRGGRKELVEITRLYEDASREGRVEREGVHDIALVEGWRTPAFGPDLKVSAFRVRSVVRHRAPKSLFTLRTRTGREVTTTGDHSVFTMISGDVRAFPVSEFSPGMYVAVPRTIPEPEVAQGSINLVECLASDDCGLYVENAVAFARLAVGEIGLERAAGLLGIRARDLEASLTKGFLAVRVASFWRLSRGVSVCAEFESLRIRPKTVRRGSLPAILQVDASLMRLIGYWVSEGMYQDRGISLFQSGAEVRADMMASVRESLGMELTPSLGSDRTRLDLNSTVALAVFKHAFGLHGGSANKTIPDIVLQQRNDLLAEFLRAYFTGDAWASSYVEASTKSRRLAGQLQYALARFGMVASVQPKVVKGQTYYSVFLYGQPNLKRFAEAIGFASREKQSQLVEFATRPIAPHTNVDTIPAVAGLLKEALRFASGKERKNLWSDWHSYWSSGKKIGRQTLQKFVEVTGAGGVVGERLLALASSDIFWDEVVGVEEIACKEEFVYDLEVPGAENFVGGEGGVFLHNTTSLNAISMFISPGQKIVSCEDTAELNLPHENWIQSITRTEGSGNEITLFDLLKAALRQRPDVIIVGEVRGKEASTLFQAIATGHGGLGTIHADSVESLVTRLTSTPMEIPKATLGSTLDCVVLQLKLRMGNKSVRRIVDVSEVVGYDSRVDQIVMNDAYRWDAAADTFKFSGRSRLFEKLNKQYGLGLDEVRKELENRQAFLNWLVAKGVRGQKEVTQAIRDFYSNPREAVDKAKLELASRAS